MTCGDYAYGVGYPVTGGGMTSGIGTNSAKTHYNCNSNELNASSNSLPGIKNMCPHWILIPTGVYENMIDNGWYNGGYDNLGVCYSKEKGGNNGDGFVAITGKFNTYNFSSIGETYILHNELNVKNNGRDTQPKEVYNYKGVSGRQVLDFFDNYTAEDPTKTYRQVFNEITNGYNNEQKKKVAAFCVGMLDDGKSLTFASKSAVQIDSAALSYTEMNGTTEQAILTTQPDHQVTFYQYALVNSTNPGSDLTNDIKPTYKTTLISSISSILSGGTIYSQQVDKNSSWSNSDDAGYSKTQIGGAKTISVHFDEPGEKLICQKVEYQPQRFAISDSGSIGSGSGNSQACARITYDEAALYTVSNVSNKTVSSGDLSYKTTNIVSSGDVEIQKTIKRGESTDITFSHNIYSVPSQSSVTYTISRDFNDGKNEKYTIDYPVGTDQSMNTDASTSSGSAQLTIPASVNSASGFTANGEYHDESLSNHYIARDVYRVTFSVNGTYSFCETISAKDSASGSASTTACSVVLVNETGTNEDPPNTETNECPKEWTPSSYMSSDSDEGTTSVIAAVRDENISNTDWQLNTTQIYAKPGDRLHFMHCYYPGVQRTFDTDATSYHARHSGDDNYNTNEEISSFKTYQNFFYFTGKNFTGSDTHSWNQSHGTSYAIGDDTIRSRKDENPYIIATGDDSRADLIISETVTSSKPEYVEIHEKSCSGWSCNCSTECDDEGNCTTTCDTCYHLNEYYPYTYTAGPASETAGVFVPFNYDLSAIIDIKSPNAPGGGVFSGETFEVHKFSVTTNARANSLTAGDENEYKITDTYATKTDDTTTTIYGFYSDSATPFPSQSQYSGDPCSFIDNNGGKECHEVDTSVDVFNKDESTGGRTEKDQKQGKFYNAYDVPTGKYFCVAAGLYPSTTDNEGNTSDHFISDPSCLQVYKKPTFQIWGGSLYSAGKVSASLALKSNLYDVLDYSLSTTGEPTRRVGGISGHEWGPIRKDNDTFYGSWTEYAAVVNNTLTNISSGASTSYTSPGLLTATNVGGSKEGENKNFCLKRAILTIANYGKDDSGNNVCDNDSVTAGQSGITINSIKEAIKNRYIIKDCNSEVKCVPPSDVDIDLSDSNNFALSGKIRRTIVSDGAKISATQPLGQDGAGVGVTHIIYVNGSVIIDDDLPYTKDNYTSISQIPQYIIYATGDIEISDNVKQIDSWLIADGEIRTPSGDNADVQLRINGPIIASSLDLGRDYGADEGLYSTESAEIMNLPASTYLWAYDEAKDAPQVYTTYLKELAPRR